MRWFKHFSDAHTSESLRQLIVDLGFEGYGRYWLLMEFLSYRFDGKNIDFSFHSSIIRETLRFRSLIGLRSFVDRLAKVRGIEAVYSGNEIKFRMPILLDLQDKDSKYNRKRIVSRSQLATLEEEVDKDLDYKKEITKVISKKELSNSLFDTVCQSWNDWSREPFKPVMGIKSDTVRKFFELVKINPNLQFPENWVRCFTEIEKNNSLNGKNQLGFVASLQWLIEKEKIVDALNGSFQKSMSEQEIIREKNNSVENPYV